MVPLASLRVAGVAFTSVKAAVHILGNGDGTCLGLLGFALSCNYLLTLDYRNHRIALTSGDLQPDGERPVLPLRMSGRTTLPVSPSIQDLYLSASLR